MKEREIFEAIANETGNGVYDVDLEWMVNETFTAETLGDFTTAAANYAESTEAITGYIGDAAYIAWKSVQPRKGDRRQELTVIDLGDRRVALDTFYPDWI